VLVCGEVELVVREFDRIVVVDFEGLMVVLSFYNVGFVYAELGELERVVECFIVSVCFDLGVEMVMLVWLRVVRLYVYGECWVWLDEVVCEVLLCLDFKLFQ
jgi:hypothetical protein